MSEGAAEGDVSQQPQEEQEQAAPAADNASKTPSSKSNKPKRTKMKLRKPEKRVKASPKPPKPKTMRLGGFYTDLLAPDPTFDFDRRLKEEGIVANKYRVSAGHRRSPSPKIRTGRSYVSFCAGALNPSGGLLSRPLSLHRGSPTKPSSRRPSPSPPSRHRSPSPPSQRSSPKPPSEHASPRPSSRHSSHRSAKRQTSHDSGTERSGTDASSESSSLPSNYRDGVYSDPGGDGEGGGEDKEKVVEGSGNHCSGGTAQLDRDDGSWARCYAGGVSGGYQQYQTGGEIHVRRSCYGMPAISPEREGLRQLREEQGWVPWAW